MLEKAHGKINVKKIRAILLLESDFNAIHKIVFNMIVLPQLEAHQLTPKEITEGKTTNSDV